jgi:hypothetical protein
MGIKEEILPPGNIFLTRAILELAEKKSIEVLLLS